MTGLPDGRRRYAAVLFDMFDTLVRLDRNRLPLVRIGDREVRSSVAALYRIARGALPDIGLERFYEAFLWSYQEAERLRAGDHREVPARERLALCYAKLGVAVTAVPVEVTETLLAAHMACLAAAAEAMPGQLALLGWLAGRFPLAVVSNFDYTPTVERILHEAGLRDRFETVVVSDTVGWRKPGARIFETACARLGVAAEACLFVGDRADIDVLGAKALGMTAAWLNPARLPLPEGLPMPDFDLAGLTDLHAILDGATECS